MERDQLFRSTIALSTTIVSLNEPQLHSLNDGLSALQDILCSPRGLSDTRIRPFYYLCSSLCDALNSRLLEPPRLDPNRGSVVLLGHDIPQISTRLLELFHALNTFLNLDFCVRAKILSAQTYQLCMSCVARSMHTLEDYQVHLKSLDEDVLASIQGLSTATCLLLYKEVFTRLGITFPQSFCECISRGSNRFIQYQDDISIIRAGEAALNHISEIGERLLEEISRNHGSMGQGDVEGIKARFKELDDRFKEALRCLKPDETLVSYEILTRGYRVDFTGLTDAALASLSLAQ